MKIYIEFGFWAWPPLFLFFFTASRLKKEEKRTERYVVAKMKLRIQPPSSSFNNPRIKQPWWRKESIRDQRVTKGERPIYFFVLFVLFLSLISSSFVYFLFIVFLLFVFFCLCLFYSLRISYLVF